MSHCEDACAECTCLWGEYANVSFIIGINHTIYSVCRQSSVTVQLHNAAVFCFDMLQSIAPSLPRRVAFWIQLTKRLKINRMLLGEKSLPPVTYSTVFARHHIIHLSRSAALDRCVCSVGAAGSVSEQSGKMNHEWVKSAPFSVNYYWDCVD